MTNARTTPTKNQKLAFKVATVMERLAGVAEDLSALYEENPDLNDIQPNSMQSVLPCSLDEWARGLNACRDDWYAASGIKTPLTPPASKITLGTAPACVGDDPDEPGKNEARAAWALVALNAFMRETGVDPEDAIADLLSNLMHLVDRAELPDGHRLHPEGFSDLLGHARSNYEYETSAQS